MFRLAGEVLSVTGTSLHSRLPWSGHGGVGHFSALSGWPSVIVPLIRTIPDTARERRHPHSLSRPTMATTPGR